MQGKKIVQEALFTQFLLSDHVPENNLYRRLQQVLQLQYLYQLTKPYYGISGQKSIDPVVFFKLCLVGYLENITSDRKLIEVCSMRLDILFFLGYNLGEPLPWHSTVSRTRQLFPESLFEQVFTQVVGMCVDKQLVSGHTQAIDSAPVKANASMDSLELKVPEQELEAYLGELRHISKRDKETYRKAKNNKATKAQQTLSADTKALNELKSRSKRWQREQTERPGAGNKGSRYTSNKTHYSPTDPDACISVKPGKARKLNYHCQLTVDTAKHVITDIKAYHADGKDNQHLQDIVNRTHQRLWKLGLHWENCLADTGYSSGENYAFLERKRLKSFIPPHGTFKGGPDGFTYEKEHDQYRCPQGKSIPFTKVFLDHKTHTKKKEYRARKQVCIDCPIRSSCLGKAQEKKFSVTYYREEYFRNIKRVQSKQGRYMKAKRSSTVEPVFGILTQFMGLAKVNTLGIQQANKCMLMAATAYNLKKYLKYTTPKANSNQGNTRLLTIAIKAFLKAHNRLVSLPQNQKIHYR